MDQIALKNINTLLNIYENTSFGFMNEQSSIYWIFVPKGKS